MTPVRVATIVGITAIGFCLSIAADVPLILIIVNTILSGMIGYISTEDRSKGKGL